MTVLLPKAAMSKLNVLYKTVGPVKVIDYLWLELDTLNMVVRIPQSKLNEVKDCYQNLKQN
jgi:hypothetical protein